MSYNENPFLKICSKAKKVFIFKETRKPKCRVIDIKNKENPVLELELDFQDYEEDYYVDFLGQRGNFLVFIICNNYRKKGNGA